MKLYDIVIIGGGPGGYVSAIKSSQLGAKVALIEKHKIGGICLNYGCIPTKAYLKNAKVFSLFKKAKEFGIDVSVEQLNFNWEDILNRKNKIVNNLTSGIRFLLKKNKVDLYEGFGEALSFDKIKVNNEIIKTKKLIIATGSSAFIPPIPGAEESYNKKYLYTSKELVQIEFVPKKMIIIGGGVISVEFATIFSNFGTEVIILEREENILNNMDHDVIKFYSSKLANNNIKVITQAQVNKIENNKVYYLHNQEQHFLTSDIILMAVGSKPNMKGIENLKLNTDKLGIVTDGFLRTSVPGVYAIGDVNGRSMLAHTASHEGMIAVHDALGLKKLVKTINYDHIPSCVYGFPEIASIGLTEEQTKLKNIDYKVSKFPVKAIGKALADGETDGFAKLIIDKNNFNILGMHIVAYNATELISEIGLAMGTKSTAYDIVHNVHPHPTLSELTLETFLGAIDKAIHI
ncbi:dihydrolipoyl dehydrogenase [Candidatus Phytoplasma palmae]|uniref:dihydrolipoyl dehydrogenase n=1 Tax=Candidatus Phytoplasma palmae TaxID=85624 RepID=UPI0039906A65